MAIQQRDLINIDELTDAQLVEVVRAFTEVEEERKDDEYARILEKKILIQGKGGRGKTLTAVHLGYELRERFGRPVICIGSKMGLKPAFGDFKVMSEQDFRDELERLDVAAREEVNAEAVAAAFEKYGISILYATLVFDEAGKLFNSRRSSEKLVQLCDSFVAQARHYHCTSIFLAPHEDEVDKRIVRQMDWKGRVYHNDWTHVARCRLVQGIEVLTFDTYGEDGSKHVPFYEMYNSWNILGYRKSQLTIKNF